MDEDIAIILKKQADALPSEIRKYVISGEWEKILDTITQHYNLSEETAGVLSREVMLVLAGLVHPGVFRGEFASNISDIDDPTINAIVKEVSDSIFQPILPTLKKFLQEQDSAPEPTIIPVSTATPVLELPKEKEKITIPAPPSLVAPQSVWEKKPEIIPENLPTGEIHTHPVFSAPEVIQNTPLSAPVPPPNNQPQGSIENTNTNEQTHPFEEKMKKVFTGGMVDRGGLVLDNKPTNEPMSGASVVGRPTHDPYREPIE